MSLLAGVFVVLAAFVTATVSGVLGMAGGLLLLGALLLVLPVAVAFVEHGLLQLVSNGWRSFLQSAHRLGHRRVVRRGRAGGRGRRQRDRVRAVPRPDLPAARPGPRPGLVRHQVVATKAATQVLSHAGKVVVYEQLVAAGTVPYAVVALAVPLSMLGTAVGGRLLDRMSEGSFTAWTRWVVTAIGGVYLVQAAALL